MAAGAPVPHPIPRTSISERSKPTLSSCSNGSLGSRAARSKLANRCTRWSGVPIIDHRHNERAEARLRGCDGCDNCGINRRPAQHAASAKLIPPSRSETRRLARRQSPTGDRGRACRRHRAGGARCRRLLPSRHRPRHSLCALGRE